MELTSVGQVLGSLACGAVAISGISYVVGDETRGKLCLKTGVALALAVPIIDAVAAGGIEDTYRYKDLLLPLALVPVILMRWLGQFEQTR